MKTKLNYKIETRKDLLRLISGLAASNVKPGDIGPGTWMAAQMALEEEAAASSAAKDRVDLLEERMARTEETYRSMLSFLAEMISETDPENAAHRPGDNGTFMVSVKQLRGFLEKEAEQGLIEKAFENLKDAVRTETRDNTRKIDRGRLLGLMGKWLKLPDRQVPPEDRYLSLFIHCKESYLQITSELRSVLSPKHGKALNALNQGINSAQSLADFAKLQDRVVDLLREYMAEAANDKAQAVFFAEEVSRKILDMDKKIAESMGLVLESQERNRVFNEKLSVNIQALREALTIGAPMKELTQVMNQKISLLSETLNRKKARDVSEEKKLKKQVASLKRGMKKVREGFLDAKRRNQALEAELNIDHLTGAASRRAYEAGISQEMLRFSRYNRPFSLIIFDIDKFKGINDTYGHAIGDKCLREITAKIKPTLRNTDILARTGGDEFVIILSETDAQQAGLVAEKIRRLICETVFIYKREKVQVSLSLGVTHVLETDDTYDKVFERADNALYQSKQDGRNRVSVVPEGVTA